MNRPETDRIAGEEEFLRAVTTRLYDEKNNRLSSAAFKGRNISVSRSSILSADYLESYFEQTLARSDRDPPIEYLGCARIENSELQELAERVEEHEALAVWATPVSDNDAHAEIAGPINRNL